METPGPFAGLAVATVALGGEGRLREGAGHPRVVGAPPRAARGPTVVHRQAVREGRG